MSDDLANPANVPSWEEMLVNVLDRVDVAAVNLRGIRGMAVALVTSLPEGTDAHAEACAVVAHCSQLIDYLAPMLQAAKLNTPQPLAFHEEDGITFH